MTEQIIEKIDLEWKEIEEAQKDIRVAMHEADIWLVDIETKGLKPAFTDGFKVELNRIEDANARITEAHESLLNLHGKLEEEHDNPHCPICGQYETVRAGVDTEGTHHCI